MITLQIYIYIYQNKLKNGHINNFVKENNHSVPTQRHTPQNIRTHKKCLTQILNVRALPEPLYSESQEMCWACS